ncbi:expressed protein [Chlorella variabilis]|uniref:Expressed protein n=1 Tax=Chlorella variabilis TaxID=554065 RepID=E1ZFT5_CHLVA|nr:expressed protein [Chlorella variabilis]EFN55338.1 expressed protein [Chlorella variabilis]|eukprot:XP_005847440.1 expressed protein [Chlorella variabilis]
MLKAFKGLKKRLGSSSKLHEEGAAADAEAHCVAAAAAAPASAAAAAALLRAGQAAVTDQAAHAEQQAGGTYAVAPPSSAPVATGLPPRPRSRPHSPTPHAYHHHSAHPLDESGGELAVDYELVAGPLELDGSLHDGQEHCVDGEERGGGGEAGAGSEQHQHHHGEPGGGAELQHEGQHPWHDSAPTSGDASTDEEAGPGAHAGDGGAAADAGSAAAAAAAAAEGIADALATMMYLTEDAEGAEDCVSVVSDALSEEDLPDDISELSRALEALEGEALHGSSPASARASLGGGGGLDDQLAERLGLSPDAGDPTAYSQQMAKLYNNLGLKMMERRKHEEALGLLSKAEAIVENDGMWGGQAHRRQRMQAITYNNLGCLFKRRNMAQLALQYLQKALALEELGGPVQNSSSTHLNISAAFSALKRPKEVRRLFTHVVMAVVGSVGLGMALAHAERAIILLQRHLAYLIASKCLGAKAPMTASLSKALKAFQQRQARYLPTGAVHAVRKAPSSLASAKVPAAQSKRGLGHSRGSSKSVSSSKSASSLASKSMNSLAAAAANGKATLPLDKASKGLTGARPASASRLATQLQQH